MNAQITRDYYYVCHIESKRCLLLLVSLNHDLGSGITHLCKHKNSPAELSGLSDCNVTCNGGSKERERPRVLGLGLGLGSGLGLGIEGNERSSFYRLSPEDRP